jgi:hypothetical protein
MLLSFLLLTRPVGHLSLDDPHLDVMYLLFFTTLVLSLGFRLLLKLKVAGGSKL